MRLLFSTVLLFMFSLLEAQLAWCNAVEEIEVGYSGLFRPNEWTLLTIKVEPQYADSKLTITVNDQFSFSTVAQGTRMRSWILLSKSSGNHLRVASAGKILFSSLQAEDNNRLWMKALPTGHRLVGVMLNASDPSPFPQVVTEKLLEHSIHIAKLDFRLLRFNSVFLESMDHIITNDAILAMLDKQSRDNLDQWVLDGGYVSNIDTLQGDRHNFLSWLTEFEDNRQVAHRSQLIDEDAYNIFEWPEYTVLVKQKVTVLTAALMLLMVMICWGLPDGRPRLSVLIFWGSWCFAMTGIAWGIPKAMNLDRDLFLLNESVRFSEFTDSRVSYDWYYSITSRRKNTLLTTHQTAHLKSILFSETDKKSIKYSGVKEGNYSQFPEYLSPGRRHLYHYYHAQKTSGSILAHTNKKHYEIENTTPFNFQECYIVVYGKLFAIKPVQKGDIVFGEMSNALSWRSVYGKDSQQSRYRGRMLRYWKKMYMNPQRIYWLGIAQRKMPANQAFALSEGQFIDLSFTEIR